MPGSGYHNGHHAAAAVNGNGHAKLEEGDISMSDGDDLPLVCHYCALSVLLGLHSLLYIRVVPSESKTRN
jgi:hypothetical protein